MIQSCLWGERLLRSADEAARSRWHAGQCGLPCGCLYYVSHPCILEVGWKADFGGHPWCKRSQQSLLESPSCASSRDSAGAAADAAGRVVAAGRTCVGGGAGVGMTRLATAAGRAAAANGCSQGCGCRNLRGSVDTCLRTGRLDLELHRGLPGVLIYRQGIIRTALTILAASRRLLALRSSCAGPQREGAHCRAVTTLSLHADERCPCTTEALPVSWSAWRRECRGIEGSVWLCPGARVCQVSTGHVVSGDRLQHVVVAAPGSTWHMYKVARRQLLGLSHGRMTVSHACLSV